MKDIIALALTFVLPLALVAGIAYGVFLAYKKSKKGETTVWR